MIKALLTTALLATLVTGCSTRTADLTIASTKNMNLNSEGFIDGSRVTGEDVKPIVIVQFGVPQMKEAVDQAIEHDSCAVGLSDVVMSRERFYFLFGYDKYQVEGNLIIDTEKKGCAKYADPDFVMPNYSKEK